MKKELLPFVIFCTLVGVLSYSNTFDVPLHFDDSSYILGNPALKQEGFLLNTSKVSGKSIDYNLKTTLSTRYVAFETFLLNYKLGGVSVAGYHIVNLAIHIINAFLLYALAMSIMRLSGADDRKSRLIAAFSALLFVSHPIQTEAVTYISQRFTSLVTLFYLSAIIFYDRFKRSSDSRFKVYYALSFACVLLAMKTKEIAFTLPFAIALYEWLFFDSTIKARLKRVLPFMLTLPLIPVSILLGGEGYMSISHALSYASRSQSALPRFDYLATEFTVIAKYIGLLFYPLTQNFDYDPAIYHSFRDIAVLASATLILLLLAFAWFMRRGNRAVSFGILFFFAALSVESSVIPIADVMYEHRLYLPSAGAFIAFSAGAHAFLERFKMRNFRAIMETLVLIVTLLLAALTYSRNTVWASPKSLWLDAVLKSPQKTRTYNNLVAALMDKRDYKGAIKYALIAGKLDNSDWVSRNNLCVAYMETGDLRSSIDECNEAIKRMPASAEVYNNLGLANIKAGLHLDALEAFDKALQLKPDFFEAEMNIGLIYLNQGSIDRAIDFFKSAIMINPNVGSAHMALGNAYRTIGDLSSAKKEYETALSLDPDDEVAKQNLQQLR